MRLSSGECLKFVQVALLYKLDVIYSKSISNDVSVPSAEKITLVDMYQESRFKDFLLLVEKNSSRMDVKFLVFLSRSLYVSLTGVLLSPYLFSHCLVAQSR